MPSVTNASTEALLVPALGRVLAPGESVEVADASAFANHPWLKVGNVTAPAPAPAPAPEPEPTPDPTPEPTPSSSIAQAAPPTETV